MPSKPISSSSPLRHHPLPSGPSPLRHRPLPPSRHRLPPFHLLSLPNTLPPLFDICSLSAPPSSSAPALFGPQRSLPFGIVRPNKTERRASVRSCLAEQRAFVRLCLAERRAMAEQRPSAKHGPSFGPVWPNGAGREGALGAKKDRCQKAGKGRRKRADTGEWERVLRKEEEMKGRGRCRREGRG